IEEQRRSVLLVDDSMVIRHSVCRWLEERGFRVETAGNGLEALRSIEARLPDVVISDLQMPVMDGAQLLRVLRASPRTAHLPVIILAGKQAVVTTGDRHIRVFKDIRMQAQLARALEELALPVPAGA